MLARSGRGSAPHEIAALLRETAEPFGDIESAELGPLLDRIGDSRLVLLGEATHGTSEFYRMRARITRELVLRKGFNVVAVEADWPDAARIDRYIRPRARPVPAGGRPTFARFPTWMWRNLEVQELVHWLRDHNETVGEPERKVGFYGLDLYSLYSSIHAVTRYLDETDPEAARLARLRYGCLTPWEQDPALYGQAALMGRYETCEPQVVSILVDLLQKQMEYEAQDAESYLEALQNARVAANAERYYRIMYYGSRESWNLRDRHMFDTLETVLRFRGPAAKAMVWEHNSHHRQRRPRPRWGAGGAQRRPARPRAVRRMAPSWWASAPTTAPWPRRPTGTRRCRSRTVRPSHPESYERLCHDTGIPAFLLHLREPRREEVRSRAGAPPPRTGDRRHLPAGDRAPEPLFPGGPPLAVRRVHLVRRDPRGHAARRAGGRGGGDAGDVSVRVVKTLTPGPSPASGRGEQSKDISG